MSKVTLIYIVNVNIDINYLHKMKNKNVKVTHHQTQDQQKQALLEQNEGIRWPSTIKTISIVISAILIVSKDI